MIPGAAHVPAGYFLPPEAPGAAALALAFLSGALGTFAVFHMTSRYRPPRTGWRAIAALWAGAAGAFAISFHAWGAQ